MLSQLRIIAQRVSQQPDLETALNTIVQLVKDAMHTDCCSVYVTDETQQSINLMATLGLDTQAVGKFKLDMGEGLVGFVVQRGELVNLARAQIHPNFKLSPEVSEDQFHAFLAVPIIHNKKVLGVIVVQQKQARYFSQDEEAFLVTLSAQLSSWLVNAGAKDLLLRNQNQHITSCLQGFSGVPGVAVGRAVVVMPDVDFNSFQAQKVYAAEQQFALYLSAVKKTKQELLSISQRLSKDLPSEATAVFDVYLQLLDAASLGREVEAELKQGWCAKSALKIVIERLIHQFDSMQDAYIKERSADLKDLSLRILSHLINRDIQIPTYPDRAILICSTLTPTLLAQIPKEKLVGVLSINGGANSHCQILLSAMGVPAVWGVNELPLSYIHGLETIIDGHSGKAYIAPDPSLTSEYLKIKDQEEKLSLQYSEEIGKTSETQDKYPFQLYLNAGLDLTTEVKPYHAAGIGLYRTEAWFMQFARFPSESEQAVWYREILSHHAPNPVVMRTLDIGGDKSLSYFEVKESNPFLGWRGIRVTLDHPEILISQLKAMIKANSELGNLRILLPMISDTQEVEEVHKLLKQAQRELFEEWQDPELELMIPELGVMLEVPASIYLIPEWQKKVDFVSVGSNDLTQYILAVDRTNSRVADLYDSFHPSVLRVLNQIAQDCNRYHLPLSICGELAANPRGAALLLAMGYQHLSMNPLALAKVKWTLRRLRLSDLQGLLSECLLLSSPAQVETVLDDFFEKHNIQPLHSVRH